MIPSPEATPVFKGTANTRKEKMTASKCLSTDGLSDLGALKGQAAERWPEILSALGGALVELLDGKNHPCPKCGGNDRFRMIDVEAGALFCNQCFNRHNGDGIAALQWLRGCDFPSAVANLTNYLRASPATAARSDDKPKIAAAGNGRSKGRDWSPTGYRNYWGPILRAA
jgi:hypothetical protein